MTFLHFQKETERFTEITRNNSTHEFLWHLRIHVNDLRTQWSSLVLVWVVAQTTNHFTTKDFFQTVRFQPNMKNTWKIKHGKCFSTMKNKQLLYFWQQSHTKVWWQRLRDETKLFAYLQISTKSSISDNPKYTFRSVYIYIYIYIYVTMDKISPQNLSIDSHHIVWNRDAKGRGSIFKLQ